MLTKCIYTNKRLFNKYVSLFSNTKLEIDTVIISKKVIYKRKNVKQSL